MPTPCAQFNSMEDAVKALLVTTVGIVSETQHKFLVIGGWVPYLRNTSAYRHPGTRDIDILFSDAKVSKALSDVIEKLLSNGFLPSAKHDFQLLLPVKVGTHELVFNVDLLHPSETIENPELLVDHFDLGINDSELNENRAVRSIVLPSSELLFRDGFFSTYQLEARALNGSLVNSTFSLLTFAGSVISKSESVSSPKRTRDAFDIFMAFQNDPNGEIEFLLRQYTRIDGVRKGVDDLKTFLSKAPEQGSKYNKFDLNVMKYLRSDCPATLPSQQILGRINDI